jgi:hypothetical protein
MQAPKPANEHEGVAIFTQHLLVGQLPEGDAADLLDFGHGVFDARRRGGRRARVLRAIVC